MGNSGGNLRRLVGTTAVVLAGLAAAAAPAAAVDRYAEPGGGFADPCTSVDPCSINGAAAVASSPDHILLKPGTYTLSAGPGQLFLPAGVTLRPELSGNRNAIVSSDGTNLIAANGSAVRDLDVSISGLSAGVPAIELQMNVDAARLQVVAEGTTPDGVRVEGVSTFRDSTVRSASAGADAVMSGNTGGITRNVTAIATGAGSVGFHADGGIGPFQTTYLTNSIVRGVGQDLRASNGTNVTIEVEYSDYVTSSISGSATIEPGLGNITGAPLFASAATGNFRQCPGSPTINTGTASSPQGISTTDLDGQSRNQGGAPDMGADEFDGTACPVAQTTEPGPTGLRAAALAKCKKKAKKKRKKCRKKAQKLPL